MDIKDTKICFSNSINLNEPKISLFKQAGWLEEEVEERKKKKESLPDIQKDKNEQWAQWRVDNREWESKAIQERSLYLDFVKSHLRYLMLRGDTSNLGISLRELGFQFNKPRDMWFIPLYLLEENFLKIKSVGINVPPYFSNEGRYLGSMITWNKIDDGYALSVYGNIPKETEGQLLNLGFMKDNPDLRAKVGLSRSPNMDYYHLSSIDVNDKISMSLRAMGYRVPPKSETQVEREEVIKRRLQREALHKIKTWDLLEFDEYYLFFKKTLDKLKPQKRQKVLQMIDYAYDGQMDKFEEIVSQLIWYVKGTNRASPWEEKWKNKTISFLKNVDDIKMNDENEVKRIIDNRLDLGNYLLTNVEKQKIKWVVENQNYIGKVKQAYQNILQYINK
jgi:hypothetical protein